jgi:hypothetical protein
VPDALSPDAGSLSARAQEILRRADAQLATSRPAASPPAAAPAPSAPAREAPPAAVRDLGELIDTVTAGIAATRAHLVALSASLERIAHELQLAGDEASSPARRGASAGG